VIGDYRAGTVRWTRDGRTATAEVDERGIIKITVELMRQMMSEAGFEEDRSDGLVPAILRD